MRAPGCLDREREGRSQRPSFARKSERKRANAQNVLVGILPPQSNVNTIDVAALNGLTFEKL